MFYYFLLFTWDLFYQDFGSFEPSRLSSSKSMLHTYLEESRLPLGELDVLSWWKTNEHRYPSVARMARDILAIPITTVASESTFSLSGRILTKYRQSTLPENAEAIVQTRSWLTSGIAFILFELFLSLL